MAIRRLPRGRRLARRPAPVVPAPAPAARPAIRILPCLCARPLEVLPSDQGKRKRCGTCFREFEVRFSPDPKSGLQFASLIYLGDGGNGETTISGPGATTIVEDFTWVQPNSKPKKGTRSGAATPMDADDLPDEVQFKCACGLTLAAAKKLFDKRIRCPDCGDRRIITLLRDPVTKSLSLQSFTLQGPRSGATQVIPKL